MKASHERATSLGLIFLALIVWVWIILEIAKVRNQAVLESISSLKSEVVELREAVVEHNDKLEWWEKD